MGSERKQEILDTAEQLFAARGYHATSMRELAQALELQGGSLYAHIRGKEELLWKILERAADQFTRSLEEALRHEGSATERLRLAIHNHVRVVSDNLDAATVYFHEWKFLSDPRRSRFLERRDWYERQMRALVAEAVERGEFRELEPKWATLMILSSVNWLYQWYRPDGPLTPDGIADRLIEMIFHGLLPAREPAKDPSGSSNRSTTGST